MNEGRDLEEIRNFILEKGETPKEYIGGLGEQFTQVLFNGIIRIIPRKKNPWPDFSIILNNKEFLLETTVLEEIYSPYYNVFCDVCREIGKENLIREYEITVDPSNIHIEDIKKFKKELKNILDGIQNQAPKKVPISVKRGDSNFIYKVTFERNYLGEVHGSASNLINKIRKKSKRGQIERSDILLLIVLNEYIEKEFELIDVLYGQKEFRVSIENLEHSTITQYNLEETVWSIGEKLKCVIAVYPGDKEIVICPSLRHNEEFSAVEYEILLKLMESNGFKVEFVKHGSDVEE